MAKAFDTRDFFPAIPDGTSPEDAVRILRDALGKISEQMEFHLRTLGAENFSAAGLCGLKNEMRGDFISAQAWSSREDGAVWASGEMCIYGGMIWKCTSSHRKSSANFPGSAAEVVWSKIS